MFDYVCTNKQMESNDVLIPKRMMHEGNGFNMFSAFEQEVIKLCCAKRVRHVK